MIATSQVTSLPVMEIFYSVQGEGFHQGKAAHFIRLGGCDVGCHWCDVKDSWNVDTHPKMNYEEIIKQLQVENSSKLIILTGGEPLMHDLEGLSNKLHENGYVINIETSGAHSLSGKLDWVCLSPKKFKEALPESFERADELKVVIYHKSDLNWAKDLAKKVKSNCKLYLQPEWDRSDIITPEIVSFIKENPEWSISLQTHKYLNIR